MLTSKDIREKAERSYKDFLLSILKKEIFFPLDIKGNKGNANMPLQDLFPALKHLIDNSKEKLGFGYTVQYKEVNTRHSGIITLPDAIFFENPSDYLKYIDREKDFTAFRKAVDLTKKELPVLLKWVENNVLKCQKYAENWREILTITEYFTQDPYPNIYWRQLPVDVDLSAAESLQLIIGELLEYVLPPQYFDKNEPSFEPRFGLKYDEPLVRIRFLDDTSYPLSISNDLSIPFSNFEKWIDLPYKNVFLISDKNVFLSYPKHPHSIAVFLDFDMALLSKMTIFHDKTTYFMGDITMKGFEQLSQIRAIYNGVKSLMMDKNTFDMHPQKQQFFKTDKAPSSLPNLTAEEQKLYTHLLHSDTKNGLLQRDIPYSFLEKTLKLL